MDPRKLAALARKNAAKSGTTSKIPKSFGKKYDTNLSDDPTDEATIKKQAENERFFAEMKKRGLLSAEVLMQKVALAVMLLGGSAGCASGPASGVSFPERNRTVLFADEIDKSGGVGQNAYDLIAQLRPEFLRSRGATTLRNNSAPPTATIYLDGVKYGDLQSLKLISAEHITVIRYLSGSEATTRYGTDHVGGAILITTK